MAEIIDIKNIPKKNCSTCLYFRPEMGACVCPGGRSPHGERGLKFPGPDQAIGQDGVRPQPLGSLSPEDVPELVLRGGCAGDFGEWPGGQKPNDGPALDGTLSNAVAGPHRGHGVFCDAVQDVPLVRVRLGPDDVLHKVNRVVGVVQDCLGVNHRRCLPPLRPSGRRQVQQGV